jgi:alpha-N-arabinofuranosidase
MTMNRREFLAASAAGAALLNQGVRAFAAPAGNIQAEVDATAVGAPITPLIFGVYMEPATTRVWAELLSDRKFYHPISSSAPPPTQSFFLRFQHPWKPVGPDGTVVMDTARPFVGDHSPRIKLAGSEPRGIQQSGMPMGRGRDYTGHVYLAGDSGAKVEARLVWGTGSGDAQTIAIPPLSAEYRKFPLHFTAGADTEDARLEIAGTGQGSFHIGAVSLMPADNVEGFHAGMVKHLKDAGFKMVKWPGGNFVSAYDWYDGIGDRDKRPPRPQPMWGDAVESNDVGLHEFIAFCRLLGAEPDLAVNTGFGEARVAAEEVEYCNGSADTRMGKLRAENGHPEPFNVRLWTVGNEMYGYWQEGHMSLDQYWVKHTYFVKAMKKVDPTIKVTSAAATPCEKSWDVGEQRAFNGPDIWRPAHPDKLPYQFGSTFDWDGWMLEKAGDFIDYVSEHTYCYPDFRFDPEAQRFVDASSEPVQFRTRRMANRIGEAFDAWQKYVEKMPSLKDRDIKFIFDEWGCRYRAPNGQRLSRRPTGMVTPLSYALFMHEMFRHSGMIAASCPTAGLGTILIDRTGKAVGFSADGLMMKLMANHLTHALPLAVSGNSPQQPVSGTVFVDKPESPTGSPTYPLDVLAALSADRKTFILSVVNPTEEAQEFTHRIGGAKLQSAGKLWQVAAPGVDAYNDPNQEPAIKINETPQGALPERIQVPPLSVSLYEYALENA